MAQLIGLARIGRDAEVRYTSDGTPVASVSLAFNYGKKDPTTNNRPTQWVDGSLWGQRAESLAPYLLKGSQFVVTLDDPHIATFQRQDGTQGHKMVGRISSVEFVGGGQNTTQAPQQPQRHSTPPPQHRPAQPAHNPYQATNHGGIADMDDDIPFSPLFSRNAYCI